MPCWCWCYYKIKPSFQHQQYQMQFAHVHNILVWRFILIAIFNFSKLSKKWHQPQRWYRNLVRYLHHFRWADNRILCTHPIVLPTGTISTSRLINRHQTRIRYDKQTPSPKIECICLFLCLYCSPKYCPPRGARFLRPSSPTICIIRTATRPPALGTLFRNSARISPNWLCWTGGRWRDHRPPISVICVFIKDITSKIARRYVAHSTVSSILA